MLGKITQNLIILAGKRLLDSHNTGEMNTGKRMLSVIAGVFILRNGIKIIYKHPVMAIQETLLGGYILYDAIKGIRDSCRKQPTEVYEVRKNQIQGNDPDSPVPAFV